MQRPQRPTLPSRALALVLLSACSAAPPAAPASPEGSRPKTAGAIHYEVVPLEGGARLSVVATFPPGLPAALHVDQNMAGWLRSPEIETRGGWSKLPADGPTWRAPGCEQGCRVRYQYDLEGAARETDDVGYAAAYPGAFVAPPSTWLLHPAFERSGVPYQFHVERQKDVAFVTGVLPLAGGAESTYGADISDLPDAPYSVFGRFALEQVAEAKGNVDVAIVNGPHASGNDTVVQWVRDGARAVSAYYGEFPIRHAAVIVLVDDSADMGYATTLGNGGGAIVARIGRDLPARRLLGSWQMTHEILHLAFPNVPRRHRWLEEGIATYVEPIARARLGVITEEEVWRGMVRGMVFAQPLPGEGGLDDTPTWGRIYWGGALFCLLADVRIRERTGNAKSLDDALRGVLAQGGNAAVRWELARVLEVGDAATGTTVLRDLHAEMGVKAQEVDLSELWARLGVRSQKGAFVFDDGAPLATVRKAITTPRAK